MARFECVCGNVLSNSLSPNEVELHVYTDYEWENIINTESLDPITIPKPKYDVWNCKKCDRLYFFKDDRVFKIYRVDTEASQA